MHVSLSRLLCGLALWFAACQAMAQDYPARAITIVVPLSTGSATDAMLRIVAQELGDAWGKPVVVVNKPGASGMIGAAAVASAAPDGYNLLAMSTNLVVASRLYANATVDPQRSLRPVVRMGSVPLVLCVNAALPAGNVQELVTLSRSRPALLSYGTPGKGSTAHLAAELFAQRAGIKLSHIPYSAVSQAQTDLAGGQLDLMFIIPSVARQLSDSGKIRCLVTNSPHRIAQFPSVPTMQQAGLQDFQVQDWIGLVGPVGMPPAVVQKVSAEVVRIMNRPEVTKKIESLGVLNEALAGKEFERQYETDFGRWAAQLKSLGIASE